MMLAEKRGLGYDDHIAKDFPELPEALGAATVRQLLHHTSGIPDYSNLNVEHPGMTNAEVLNALRNIWQAPVSPRREIRIQQLRLRAPGADCGEGFRSVPFPLSAESRFQAIGNEEQLCFDKHKPEN